VLRYTHHFRRETRRNTTTILAIDLGQYNSGSGHSEPGEVIFDVASDGSCFTDGSRRLCAPRKGHRVKKAVELLLSFT
jgi:hypothetical protein